MRYSEGDQLYRLFEELIKTKREQRAVEERLFQTLGKPMHRKWMHERVQDQYKHEKIINDIATFQLHTPMVIKDQGEVQPITGTAKQELNQRLEGVAENIQLMTQISQPIEDFKLYKMINGMLSDEYIYQTRLVKIITER